ncbi:hypothetical protein GUJ93_ZPchr0015g6731 [Zizania palustris]|uniref:Uncharacterized protein n=1 Tax=Zizania palustris TaxID=103762 RepID=A0A8J5SYP7_ZIZPA|nr:hypothetical protein GUJ93_ZPchr0015g6731 [Zizania palustris]
MGVVMPPPMETPAEASTTGAGLLLPSPRRPSTTIAGSGTCNAVGFTATASPLLATVRVARNAAAASLATGLGSATVGWQAAATGILAPCAAADFPDVTALYPATAASVQAAAVGVLALGATADFPAAAPISTTFGSTNVDVADAALAAALATTKTAAAARERE